ncbi:MAG: ATP-binding cassette domain-containing protein [Campylobacterales bacterium]|nr:ATP-binding cassette domain-containing protein [Campylobacterales bacterium]
MKIYNDAKTQRDDLDWLINSCFIPQFANSRISKYEYEKFDKMALEEASPSKEFTLELYENLFSAYNLKAPKWTSEINEDMLPAIVFLPEIGLKIVLERVGDGTWKCDGPDGIKYYDLFLPSSIFASIRVERVDTKKRSAYDMFRSIALEQKKFVIQAAIATVSINLLALSSSFFSMQVYDRVIPTKGLSTLVSLAIGVFIAIGLEMILKIARSIILDHASTDMDRRYSHDIFSRFLKIRSDALPKSVGTLSGQLQSYAFVRGFISSAAIYIVIDFPFVLLFIAVIIMLGGISMGMIPLVFLAVSLATAWRYKNKIEELTKASTFASHKKLGVLVETVENAENIKATGGSYSVQNRWNALTEDVIHDDITIKHYTEQATFFAAFFQQISYVSLIAWGAYLASTTDQITMGSLIAIAIISGRVLAPVAQLPGLFVQWGRAKEAIDNIEQIYQLPLDNEGVDRPLMPQHIEPKYELQNVAFAYSEESRPISFKKLIINKGERIGVLGPIGSGKSTLLKLLSGMYAPKSGNILLGGIDMQHISRDRVSSLVGYLPQSTKLISGTLRDNLLLGLVGIDDMSIMEAAKKTGLDRLINILPQGLDTMVPEGGESVSGGQKQLIAVTRLILWSPLIWLLDEPTANMDDVTERYLLRVLNENISKEQTLVLVTHKPALLSIVDRLIIVTNDGIVADGPKNAVLQKLKDNQQKAKQTAQGAPPPKNVEVTRKKVVVPNVSQVKKGDHNESK